MAISLTKHQRAQILIVMLGVGLAIALWPYTTGLIGAPVLAVMCRPFYVWLERRVKRSVAAALVVTSAAFLLIVPGLSFAAIAVTEAQHLAGDLVNSPVLAGLYELSVGDFEFGQALVKLGQNAVEWIGASAFGLIGTATQVCGLPSAFFWGVVAAILSILPVVEAASCGVPRRSY